MVKIFAFVVFQNKHHLLAEHIVIILDIYFYKLMNIYQLLILKQKIKKIICFWDSVQDEVMYVNTCLGSNPRGIAPQENDKKQDFSGTLHFHDMQEMQVAVFV